MFLQPRYNDLSRGAKMMTALLPNTAMAYSGQIFSMFEGTGLGVQWSTINEGSSPDDSMSMLDMFIMLVVDGILLLTLAWYIEGVRPGDFGVPLPWHFPFTVYTCKSGLYFCIIREFYFHYRSLTGRAG